MCKVHGYDVWQGWRRRHRSVYVSADAVWHESRGAKASFDKRIEVGRENGAPRFGRDHLQQSTEGRESAWYNPPAPIIVELLKLVLIIEIAGDKFFRDARRPRREYSQSNCPVQP